MWCTWAGSGTVRQDKKHHQGWSTLESCVDASHYPSIQHGICWEKLVLTINMRDEKNMSVLFRAVSENLKSSPQQLAAAALHIGVGWGAVSVDNQWTKAIPLGQMMKKSKVNCMTFLKSWSSSQQMQDRKLGFLHLVHCLPLHTGCWNKGCSHITMDQGLQLLP